MAPKSIVVAGALALAAVAGSAHAVSFVNGSFEDGVNPGSGWTASDLGLIQTLTDISHDGMPPGGGNPPYMPTDGSVFAMLTAGGVNTPTTLTQTFTTAGGQFTGSVAFLARDYIDVNGTVYTPPGSFNDNGYIRLSGVAGDVFFRDIATVGNYGQTGWLPIDFTLLAGTYTLEIGVVNITDGANPSRLLVDNLSIPAEAAAVPEPATWVVLLSGFFGLGAMVRRRRAALA